MEQFALEFGVPERQTYTVSELNAAIRAHLSDEFFDVWVGGEISSAKLWASGHYYFTLKDGESQISCVCFKSTVRLLKFKPQDGVQVLARGRVDLWEQRGNIQLIVETLEPQGHGALQFAFEQLKKRLAAEGLFDRERKRPLPLYPRKLGIVTSPRGAVISDMIQILTRRFPGLHIRLYPAPVQGEGSIEEVCRGIEYFSASQWPDVLIVARGGGSLEDLWTFNEEAVARAIATCSVPVVSAVGHETDVTIADFVADLRAPTPSAAAELVVRQKEDVAAQLAAIESKLVQTLRYRLALRARRLHQQGIDRALSVVHRNVGRRAQQIDEWVNRLRHRTRELLDQRRLRVRALEAVVRDADPRPRLERSRRRQQNAGSSIIQAIRLQMARRRARLETLRTKVEQLSPLTILNRGYAIVTTKDGHVVVESSQAPDGAEIRVRLARGRLDARVIASHESSG
ncbi:MAG: exodeoxyribonuclease VII large subunit [Bryobacteraceae bacterium]